MALEVNLESQKPTENFLFCLACDQKSLSNSWGITKKRFTDLLKVFFVWPGKRLNRYLFLHCKTVVNLWNMFICILEVSWVMPKTTLELLNSWNGIGRRRQSKYWWMSYPICIWWTLWKERNTRCFECKSCNERKIKMKRLSLFFFWCKHNMVGEGSNSSWFHRRILKLFSFVKDVSHPFWVVRAPAYHPFDDDFLWMQSYILENKKNKKNL